MAAEKDYEEVFRRSLGVYFPNRHRVRKHHADEYTGKGHPDFYGHILGKYVEFELKVKPNRPTVAQIEQLQQTASTGGITFLLIKDGDTHWLIGSHVLDGFSYKNRTGWIPLTETIYKTAHGAQSCINLMPLRMILEMK